MERVAVLEHGDASLIPRVAVIEAQVKSMNEKQDQAQAENREMFAQIMKAVQWQQQQQSQQSAGRARRE
jgi:ABC-type lipoprotein release transport system permease subunit